MLKIVIILWSLGGWAKPLPENHFLFPRDFEPIWLIGIERDLNKRGMERNIQKCKTGEQMKSSFRQFHCESFKNSHTLPIFPTYDKKFFAQFNFFGETHVNQEGQGYLAQIIRNAPQGFFKVLAMEMFNSKAQEEIDLLIQNKAPLKKWRELLSSHWGYQLDGYIEIIKAALSQKMKIVAIDDRREEHSDSFSDDLIYRDQVMAREMGEATLNNPQERFVILTGNLHSLKKLSTRPITVVDEMHALDKSRHYIIFPERGNPFFKSFYPLRNEKFILEAQKPLKDYADFFVIL